MSTFGKTFLLGRNRQWGRYIEQIERFQGLPKLKIRASTLGRILYPYLCQKKSGACPSEANVIRDSWLFGQVFDFRVNVRNSMGVHTCGQENRPLPSPARVLLRLSYINLYIKSQIKLDLINKVIAYICLYINVYPILKLKSNIEISFSNTLTL